MKDQITTLMEALRLVGNEVELLKRHRQGRDQTLNAIDRILADPRVASAVRSVEPFVGAPTLVPDHINERSHA